MSQEIPEPIDSLPRYDEPTPETHRKLSREEEAELALKHTAFTRGARPLLIILFLITIVAVPAIQFLVELPASRISGRLPTLDVFKVLPAWARMRTAKSVTEVWALLPHAADLKAAEEALESESIVARWLLPRVQSVLTGTLGVGNEQVYLGRDSWLFYRADVDYITGPPFLDPRQMACRARAGKVQPDPAEAIIHFKDQLAARQIALIVVPIPVKPGIEGNRLSARVEPHALLRNSSFSEFKARLQKGGVRVFDAMPFLMEQKAASGNAALYMEDDTHWRPEIMELIARNLAASIQAPPSGEGAPFLLAEKEISGVGDIVAMLKLPLWQTIYRPERVTIRQVMTSGGAWHSTKEADILLLGDSFSNVFSSSALGWGDSAGFAEHLSRALDGRPLDCIIRNSDAAFATREVLCRDLARNSDRLAGKKLVVWEFAERELAFGNWKLLEMNYAPSGPE